MKEKGKGAEEERGDKREINRVRKIDEQEEEERKSG